MPQLEIRFGLDKLFHEVKLFDPDFVIVVFEPVGEDRGVLCKLNVIYVISN